MLIADIQNGKIFCSAILEGRLDIVLLVLLDKYFFLYRLFLKYS